MAKSRAKKKRKGSASMNKETLTAYGKLVVDFANAITTEEAGLLFIENSKRALNFSDEYVNVSKMHFGGHWSSVPDSDLAREVERVRKEYLVKLEHDYIRNLQKQLRDSLEYIIVGGDFTLQSESNPCRSLWAMRGMGNVRRPTAQSTRYIEEHYLTHRVYAAKGIEHKGLALDPDFEFYDEIIAHCLFKLIESKGRKNFKKCPYCENYFIAADAKRIRCESEDCRKTYEREKKRRQREEEPEIYS